MRPILIILCCIFALIIIFVIAFVVSPTPSAWLVHKLFKEGVAIAPEDYTQYETQVEQQSDIEYPSIYKNNTLDIISPKDASEPKPTIIWIHGGAFVGGDKKDITEYAVMLAANGYQVVNANYELAPSAKYPTPILQVNDVYQFVLDNTDKYGFDPTQIYFAGDSAGAQIVSQYALIQTNADYAKQVDIAQLVPTDTIKGLLLYCGPYDIAKLSNLSDNKLVAFLLGRVGWAYIGEKDWVSSESAKFASTKDFVTASYPPSFITDGNVMTFTEHGQDLADELDELGVKVTPVFYDADDASLPHEYQFIFNTPEAELTFDATLKFLHETSTK